MDGLGQMLSGWWTWAGQTGWRYPSWGWGHPQSGLIEDDEGEVLADAIDGVQSSTSQKWPQWGENTIRIDNVAGGDHGHNEGLGWSQNLGLNNGKPSGWLALLERPRWHKKMARTVTAAVRNDEQNVVVDDDYDGASSSRGSGWIANHEVVMMAIVQWPESCRWQAKVAAVLGLKSTKNVGEIPGK